ncbi:MAG: tetratricopeptide repeat protein, partial [Candidatus Cybelea sp.]
AIQNYEAAGAKVDVAWTMNRLGWVELSGGNPELSLMYAKRALEALRAFNYVHAIANTLNMMAMALVSMARCDEAQASAREALAIAVLRPNTVAEERASKYEWATEILGCADAWLTAMGSGREAEEQQEYDRALAILRDGLGADAVANLMASSAAMTEEQVVDRLATI